MKRNCRFPSSAINAFIMVYRSMSVAESSADRARVASLTLDTGSRAVSGALSPIAGLADSFHLRMSKGESWLGVVGRISSFARLVSLIRTRSHAPCPVGLS